MRRTQAWTFEHGLHILCHQVGAEGLGFEVDIQALCLQLQQTWWLRTVVDHRDLGTLQDTPTHHGQARVTQTEHQDVKVLQHVHGQRSFKVDKPTKHNNMVMIQKRTTTWVSFHPDFSK